MNNTTRNIIGKLTLCFVLLWCNVSCGLETISYLDNISGGSYRDTGATVLLPSASAAGYRDYFDNFVIYYRIYISGELTSSVIDTDNARSLINSMLNSDFIFFDRYTDTTSTTVYPLTQTTFPSRGYYQLELQGAGINMVLGSNSLGGILEISFSTNPGVNPVLILNGISYPLYRAESGNGINFTPKPDRRFLNDAQLYDSTLAINPSQSSTRDNADVYGRTQTSPPSRYTYVSMYIVAQGTSFDMPPQTIYSQPTFIGIFRLSEAY
jgi:hypothetical protein